MLEKIKNASTRNSEVMIRNKITMISFLCSIFVIYIHTYNLTTYGIEETSGGLANITYHIQTYWNRVISIAVPIFFMISGILFFRTFEVQQLSKKLKNRFFTIGVPYLVWSSLYYLYNVICTNVPIIKSIMNGDEIIEFSLQTWIRWLWVDSYYTLWFLQNLMIFILLSPIIWILLKNYWKQIPTGFVTLLILLFILIRIVPSVANLSGLTYYLVGCYIGIHGKKLLTYKNTYLSIASLIYILYISLTGFKIWHFALEMLFFICIWFALDLVTRRERKLPWWMSITFFTYVAHDVFLQAFEKLVWVIGGDKVIFALLDYIFMPVFVLIFLIFIAFIIRNWFPLIWKVLTGDRAKAKNTKKE